MSHIGEIVSAPRTHHPADLPVNAHCDGSERAHKFDITARIRFLDCLATTGNVRSAAARVGVSRETAYRARRRDGKFSDLWDAALIHARHAAEAELATRALDGVPVPVYARGEHVATWHRQDTRLLLAHLGRLDARVADDKAAAARARDFDRRLAAMAGHEAPDDFEDAAEMTQARDGSGVACYPERSQYVLYACEDAVEARVDTGVYAQVDTRIDTGIDTGESGALQDDTLDEIAQEAGGRWDAWDRSGARLLDRMLEGGGAASEAADPAPIEVDRGGERKAQDSVTSVNRASRRRAMKARRKAERQERGKRPKSRPPSSNAV